MGERMDHGELNLPLTKRYGRGGIDAAIDKHLAAERIKAAAEFKARARAAREAEAARVRLTREECKDARVVRDRFGWHVVVRVNAKTVTVKTPYSWTETIPFAKLLEVRS